MTEKTTALGERLYLIAQQRETGMGCDHAPIGEWCATCREAEESTLREAASALAASDPLREALTEQDDLGLSIDMLDVDRLRDWARTTFGTWCRHRPLGVCCSRSGKTTTDRNRHRESR